MNSTAEKSMTQWCDSLALEKAAGLPLSNSKELLQIVQGKPLDSLKELVTPALSFMTILIWLTYFFNLLLVYELAAWLPSLLVKAGFTLVNSYSLGMIQTIGASFGGFFLGWLMDRFGRSSSLAFTYLAGGLMIVLFGTVASNVAMYIAGAATGVFVTGAQIAQHVASGELYPANIRSRGVGYPLTAGRLGAIAGPLLGGALQMTGFTFTQFFLIFAVPSLASAVLVMLHQDIARNERQEMDHEKFAALHD